MFDSINTVAFNHSAIIYYNHLHLQGLLLPNNRLWLTTNSSEFMEKCGLPSNLHPISFLGGLQTLFNSKPVATQHFGYVILIAGLFNKGRLNSQYNSQLKSALNSWKDSIHSIPRPKSTSHGIQVLLILYYMAQMDVHLTLNHLCAIFHILKFLLSVLQQTSTPAYTLKDFLLNQPLALHMAVSITQTFVSALKKLVLIIGTKCKEDQIWEFFKWADSIKGPDELL